ncbi:MAG: hypothetical protein NTV73_01350 [Hyphomicrobiales bacterium]|nr:hypothetical protein [Hyphomicrobiales bacterium]
MSNAEADIVNAILWRFVDFVTDFQADIANARQTSKRFGRSVRAVALPVAVEISRRSAHKCAINGERGRVSRSWTTGPDREARKRECIIPGGTPTS